MKYAKQLIRIGQLIAICMISLLIISCSHNNNIEDGDLLFVSKDNGSLSGAIDRVTQTDQSTNYVHVAIIEKRSGKIMVWDSSPKYGTQRTELNEFIQKQKGEVYQYRLKKEYQDKIKGIWEKAETMLGKPYNYSYILNDSSFYCSDFVYRLFSKDSIFELNPMTFINPETGEYDPEWVKHYNELGIEIPEGKPGCNPNGMADNNKLSFIGKLVIEQKQK